MASILLVEDHVDSATMLALGLEHHGNKVTVAHSVAMALECAAADSAFDVLVTDLSLPDGSGFSLLHGLRQRGFHFPAVAMSGYCSAQDISRCEKAGFATHLTKPVTSQEIIAAIQSVLRPAD